MTLALLRRLALSAFLLLAVQPLHAQDGTPEAAVRAYYAALQRDGLVSAADHMHPAELERFKSMLLPIFQAGEPARQLDMSKAFFGATATPQTAAAASAREFMRAFLSLTAQQPGFASVKFQSPSIVGSVQEGETVHIVTRTQVAAGELSITQMEVTSLRKDGDTWRLLLNGNMEGMAQALRQRAQRR